MVGLCGSGSRGAEQSYLRAQTVSRVKVREIGKGAIFEGEVHGVEYWVANVVATLSTAKRCSSRPGFVTRDSRLEGCAHGLGFPR